MGSYEEFLNKVGDRYDIIYPEQYETKYHKVQIGNKYGVVNSDGDLVLPVEYENLELARISFFGECIILRDSNNGYTFLDSNGSIIEQPDQYDRSKLEWKDVGAGVSIACEEKYYDTALLTSKGVELYPHGYENVYLSKNGICILRHNHTSGFYAFDAVKGIVLSELEAYTFNNIYENYGEEDFGVELLTEEKVIEGDDVLYMNTSTLVDFDGNVIYKDFSGGIEYYFEGKRVIMYSFDKSLNKVYGFGTVDHPYSIDYKYEYIDALKKSDYLYRDDFYLDVLKEVDYVGKNDLYLVRKNHKYGVISEIEEEIIPIMYDHIIYCKSNDTFVLYDGDKVCLFKNGTYITAESKEFSVKNGILRVVTAQNCSYGVCMFNAEDDEYYDVGWNENWIDDIQGTLERLAEVPGLDGCEEAEKYLEGNKCC